MGINDGQRWIHLIIDSSPSRFERGSLLRILDSKDPKDCEILAAAPQLRQYLSKASLDRFDSVLKLLSDEKISFIEDPMLVRGLDYYSHTVFEFVSSHKGRQNALIAGGRYDGLVELLGGPKACPGVGYV